MTTTKTRILHAVPDAPAKVIETVTPPARQQAALTRDREAAHAALTIPDVEQDLLDAVAATTSRLAEPGARQAELLIDLARRMYVHGHMDGAANRKATARHLKAEQDVLAEVVDIETAERKALAETERALRVVRP